MTDMINVKLGNKIRFLRKKANYSQEEFADKVGVHRTYIGCIERGEKNVTIQTIKKISVALGIKIEDLLRDI